MEMVICVSMLEMLIFILFISLIAFFKSRFELYDLMEERENKRERQKREQKEEDKLYMSLMNKTTNEIINFRNRAEFIKTIKDYDMIKHFLKGTEEENMDQLLKWYYPEYKKM